MCLVVELVALPPAVGGGGTAQVNRDVEDPAARAADELGLSGTGLEVEAPQRARPGARVVVLHELDADAQFAPGFGTEGLDQEAALVAVDLRLDQDKVRELRLQPGGHQPSARPYCRS